MYTRGNTQYRVAGVASSRINSMGTLDEVKPFSKSAEPTTNQMVCTYLFSCSCFRRRLYPGTTTLSSASQVHSGGKRLHHQFRALYDFYGKRVDYGEGDFPSCWPTDITQASSCPQGGAQAPFPPAVMDGLRIWSVVCVQVVRIL